MFSKCWLALALFSSVDLQRFPLLLKVVIFKSCDLSLVHLWIDSLIAVDGKLGMDANGEEKNTRCWAPSWSPCRPSSRLQPQVWWMPQEVLFHKRLSECCSLKVELSIPLQLCVQRLTLSNPFLKENGAWHAQYGCLGEGKVLLIISYCLCG